MVLIKLTAVPVEIGQPQERSALAELVQHREFGGGVEDRVVLDRWEASAGSRDRILTRESARHQR
ncbi:hypothetical protein ACFYT3_30650 [Nocardia amikacinitolerans]|uniref:hypothetical protein n=1 Tax=Nocardia amikacinitolerans TaxID=756689 RepID=UPI0036B3FF7C